MEGITTRAYKGVKGYWRRRRYQRLGGKTRDESEPKRRSRFWRFRLTRKLKLKFKFRCSAKKLLIGIRDGYVRMMMRLANSSVVAGSGGGYGDGIARFGKKPVKEYDEKMIIEIYKSLAMRQAQFGTDRCPQITISR